MSDRRPSKWTRLFTLSDDEPADERPYLQALREVVESAWPVMESAYIDAGCPYGAPTADAVTRWSSRQPEASGLVDERASDRQITELRAAIYGDTPPVD